MFAISGLLAMASAFFATSAASRVLAADPAHWERAGNGLFTQTVKYVQIFRATYKYLATPP